MSKAILVTGATGKQGGAVIDALLALPSSTDFAILGVTRSAESATAKKLVEKGVKIVQGDLNDVDGIFKEAAKVVTIPIWGVFSVQVPMGKGATVATEEAQGKSLIDISIANKVKHFVYTSVDRGGSKSIDNPTPIPHFISKHNIERHLIDKAGKDGESMSWTILRPTAFMNNFSNDFMGKGFATMYRIALKGKPLQLIAVSDIGVFAAKAFEKPQEFNGKAISLAGADITFDQVKEIFKERTGNDVPTTFGFLGSAILWGVKEVGKMFDWFYTDGYGANIDELKEMHPGLLDLGTWLEKEGGFPLKK
ncbi:hypothetical protein FKW77_010512 [Venturia effusa]|uniref:NmrA-like domain-containing protein n=1 Tax=Venturia effusa TaxID=50376 RepID=A0A517L2G2_9PEZI|nr:hypothetical protein FKW77_010512 [Venturia effusa]